MNCPKCGSGMSVVKDLVTWQPKVVWCKKCGHEEKVGGKP